MDLFLKILFGIIVILLVLICGYMIYHFINWLFGTTLKQQKVIVYNKTYTEPYSTTTFVNNVPIMTHHPESFNLYVKKEKLEGSVSVDKELYTETKIDNILTADIVKGAFDNTIYIKNIA